MAELKNRFHSHVGLRICVLIETCEKTPNFRSSKAGLTKALERVTNLIFKQPGYCYILETIGIVTTTEKKIQGTNLCMIDFFTIYYQS